MEVDVSYWHSFLHWIALHPNISYGVIFMIALTESLAVVGLLVPGTVLLLSVGTLVGNGALSWQITIVVATLGAIAGDGISYWLGCHYHQQIKTFWPLSSHPKIIARGEVFFQRHGGKSVFIGRFVGPIRPIIPLVAGMLNMSRRYFYCVNALSAIIWAVVYLFPGVFLVGWLKVLTVEGRHSAILTLLVLILLWLSFCLTRMILTINER